MAAAAAVKKTGRRWEELPRRYVCVCERVCVRVCMPRSGRVGLFFFPPRASNTPVYSSTVRAVPPRPTDDDGCDATAAVRTRRARREETDGDGRGGDNRQDERGDHTTTTTVETGCRLARGGRRGYVAVFVVVVVVVVVHAHVSRTSSVPAYKPHVPVRRERPGDERSEKKRLKQKKTVYTSVCVSVCVIITIRSALLNPQYGKSKKKKTLRARRQNVRKRRCV